MSLEIKSGSAYRDMAMVDQRIPNISLNDPNSTSVQPDRSIPEAMINNNQNQNGSRQENEKRGPGNSENQIKAAINKANNQLKFTGTRCEFKYYDDINRVAIKVIDKNTDEIIREIPPEETLELVQKLWEFAGLLYDEKG